MRGIGRAVLVVCAMAVGGFAVAASSGAAATKTRATIFRPFGNTGAPTVHVRTKSGHCFTGSLAVNRNDAWRCFTGNFILDPCFSSASKPGVVICPNRDVNGGVEIKLTRKLPQGSADRGSPSRRHQPWDVELLSGTHCAFSSGASSEVGGVRLNYFCGRHSKKGLWGFPNRHVEPWTIRIAPFTAKSLTRRARIRAVWM